MDIRSSVDGLRNLLGVPANATEQTQQVKSQTGPPSASFSGDHATLSNAGSEVALAAGESDARMDKVAAVRAAIAGGEYSVPAGAVASKVVDSMLLRSK